MKITITILTILNNDNKESLPMKSIMISIWNAKKIAGTWKSQYHDKNMNEKLFSDSGHRGDLLLGCMIKAYSAVGIHQLGCWLVYEEQLQHTVNLVKNLNINHDIEII